MQAQSLSRSIQILFLFFLVFAGLYFAKPFLVPFIIAGILAMLFLPLSRKIEKKGINRGLAALFCVLILVAVMAGVITMLCGLLEIVPFIGNLTGTALTLIMALSQGGGANMAIGILITYGCVQFIQTYILEPLVVGAQVKMNPLFTIIAIVIGELIWGIPGMILAIPLLGIAKIIFDNVDSLKPYGFLIAEEKKKGDTSFVDKIKGWFK